MFHVKRLFVAPSKPDSFMIYRNIFWFKLMWTFAFTNRTILMKIKFFGKQSNHVIFFNLFISRKMKYMLFIVKKGINFQEKLDFNIKKCKNVLKSSKKCKSNKKQTWYGGCRSKTKYQVINCRFLDQYIQLFKMLF